MAATPLSMSSSNKRTNIDIQPSPPAPAPATKRIRVLGYSRFRDVDVTLPSNVNEIEATTSSAAINRRRRRRRRRSSGETSRDLAFRAARNRCRAAWNAWLSSIAEEKPSNKTNPPPPPPPPPAGDHHRRRRTSVPHNCSNDDDKIRVAWDDVPTLPVLMHTHRALLPRVAEYWAKYGKAFANVVKDDEDDKDCIFTKLLGAFYASEHRIRQEAAFRSQIQDEICVS